MAGNIEKEIKEMKVTLDRLEKETIAETKSAEKAAKELGGVKLTGEDKLLKAKEAMGKAWKQVDALNANSPPPEFKKAYKTVEGIEADVKDACQRLDREIAEARKEHKTEAASTEKELDEMRSSLSRLNKRISEARVETEKAMKKAAAFPDLMDELDPKPISKLEAKQSQVQKMVGGLSPGKSAPSEFKKVSAAVDDLSDEVDDVSRRAMRDIADVEKDMKERKV